MSGIVSACKHGEGVVDGEREHRHAIERAAGRQHAGGRDEAALGFSPTILLSPAGTRPEPAVSVPSATGTSPAATATAEPELDPPEINPSRNGLRGMP